MKALDFNALQQPTWEVKLKDEAQTTVHLSTPTVDLVDRLISATPELQEVTKTKDGRAIRAVYDLIAELMSCNEDGYKFNGDELLTKYRRSLLDVFRFAAGYMDFIKELNDAKN